MKKIIHLFKKEIEYEKCIICKKETPFTKNQPIEERYGYMEGAGQLCHSCYNEIKGDKQ